MTYTWPLVSGAPIIALEGEAGPAMIIALQRRIVRALDTGHPRVVVDMGAVTGLGGQTSSLLCGALRFVSRCGATLAIARQPSRADDVTELCEIEGVAVYPTVYAALRSMR